MDVRDAVESDAERLAGLTNSPAAVLRNLVHNRTVRVAIDRDTRDSPVHEGTFHSEERTDDDAISGFVSFDVRDSIVHLTQLSGTLEACQRLLDEPIRFARRENMAVELLVPEGEETVKEAVEGAGFEAMEAGPRFEGQATTRYRLEIDDVQQYGIE